MKKNRIKNISIYCLSYSDPATYYRLIQYVPNLEGKIRVRYLCPDYLFRLYMKFSKKKSKLVFVGLIAILGYFMRLYQLISDIFFIKPDIIIVGRTIYPKISPLGLKILKQTCLNPNKRNILWDFDDNISLKESEKSEFNLLSLVSSRIFVTSDYLRNTLPKKAQSKVLLLPTTDIAYEKFNSHFLVDIRKKSFDKDFNMIWIGTHYSMMDVKEIIYELEAAAFNIKKNLNKTTYLTVISNEELESNTEYLIIRNIPWSREAVGREMKKAHLGLMPLKETEFSLGKGGFKAVQYLGASIPVILSNVGYNKYVIKSGYNGYFANSNDWSNKIITIAGDYQMWESMSYNSREFWEENFSSKNNLKIINDHIHL